uniref:uncharacterized protein isoform X1 n=2 Tax=Myxine glutinosa TaxID=7769 RepID=UPI00358F75FB
MCLTTTMGLQCPTLLHHAAILGLITLLCHETLEQEHCGCMEKYPPSSVNLSVSQQTTTIIDIVNGRAEFHCDVSMKSSYTDNPIVYWYKHCPNSFTGKTVFSGKSASVEYINRANQTVHEIQEHSNLRRRRFTLEIFQLNVNDSGDYFCVIKIRTRHGAYAGCGGGTRLEVVETLELEHCGCMEITPPSSVNLSVSQPTTTTTAIVNGRAEFHCDVSMKSSYTDNHIVYITDNPIVYWYKHCPNSFTRKTVFSGKSASEEYINRAKQTVHEIQEHSNLRRRRFTLEIFQLNLNDSGDYFCVIRIRTSQGSYGDCGGGTRLEVVDQFTEVTTTISNSNIKDKASTFKPTPISPFLVFIGFILGLAGVIAIISIFRGLLLIIKNWKLDPYHKNQAAINTPRTCPAFQMSSEEGIYSDVIMRPRMSR